MSRISEPATSFIELAEAWDLARVIPANLRLPRWARSRGGSWSETGHRLVCRLWDHEGRAISIRARCLKDDVTPKSLAPAGYSTKCLVFADPLGVQLLSGIVPEWWESPSVVIAEGEVDFLSWAARQSDSQEQGPAYFGVEAGAWSQEIAARFLDGAAVFIRTDHDRAGDRYAEKIGMTLSGRCRLYRSQAEAYQ